MQKILLIIELTLLFDCFLINHGLLFLVKFGEGTVRGEVFVHLILKLSPGSMNLGLLRGQVFVVKVSHVEFGFVLFKLD